MEALPVLRDVRREMMAQQERWGEQNHLPVEWIGILGEEFGESAKAALNLHFDGSGGHKVGGERTHQEEIAAYRRELVQVAAVACSAIASLDRNHGGPAEVGIGVPR